MQYCRFILLISSLSGIRGGAKELGYLVDDLAGDMLPLTNIISAQTPDNSLSVVGEPELDLEEWRFDGTLAVHSLYGADPLPGRFNPLLDHEGGVAEGNGGPAVPEHQGIHLACGRVESAD